MTGDETIETSRSDQKFITTKSTENIKQQQPQSLNNSNQDIHIDPEHHSTWETSPRQKFHHKHSHEQSKQQQQQHLNNDDNYNKKKNITSTTHRSNYNPVRAVGEEVPEPVPLDYPLENILNFRDLCKGKVTKNGK